MIDFYFFEFMMKLFEWVEVFMFIIFVEVDNLLCFWFLMNDFDGYFVVIFELVVNLL